MKPNKYFDSKLNRNSYTVESFLLFKILDYNCKLAIEPKIFQGGNII